jgi:ribosomal protein S18 acetylase RimI-like enzyme
MITYRKLAKGDQERLIEIFQQPSALFDFSEFDENALIADNNCDCLVIEKDSEIIGFSSLITYRVPTKGLVARIEDVIVDEKYRGQGIGRGVMEKLIEMAKEKNISMIELTSKPERIVARKLYESLGFVVYNTGVFRLKIR